MIDLRYILTHTPAGVVDHHKHIHLPLSICSLFCTYFENNICICFPSSSPEDAKADILAKQSKGEGENSEIIKFSLGVFDIRASYF